MDQATLVAIVATVVLLAGMGVLIGLTVSTRRRLESELEVSRSEVDALRTRLDGLTSAAASQEFVITDLEPGAGLARPDGEPADLPVGVTVGPPLNASAFVSVVVGESMLKAAALGHGLGRALSAENRNRITFEMRRETKRSRKQRRAEVKAARRQLRAHRVGSVAGSIPRTEEDAA